jgi:hypothetical protein
MTIEERIKQHEERVTGTVSHRYASCCPRCGEEDRFQRHEIRRRKFYFVTGNREAMAVRSWLVRWRCGNCDVRFTDYPTFALPYKRFVKPVVFEMAAEFLSRHTSSYRGVSDDKASHSSLWRWLSWLDGLWEHGCKAVRFILAAEPNSLIHRYDGNVAPQKYRSTSRCSTLLSAFQTLTRILAYERLVTEFASPSLEQHEDGT